MKASVLLIGALAVCGSACHGEVAKVETTTPTVEPPSMTIAAAPTPAPPPCAHTACGDSYFVDLVGPSACSSGASCDASVRLVALGDYHINDEYPYKFTGDDDPGISYLGTLGPAKNVFSRPAGDWTQTDPKSGALAIHFKTDGAGTPLLSGTLKLSVCSKEKCLLEQRAVSAPIAVR